VNARCRTNAVLHSHNAPIDRSTEDILYNITSPQTPNWTKGCSREGAGEARKKGLRKERIGREEGNGRGGGKR